MFSCSNFIEGLPPHDVRVYSQGGPATGLRDIDRKGDQMK